MRNHISRALISILMAALLLTPDLYANGGGVDIILLKDGSVIRGEIIESDLESRVMIKTEDEITIVIDIGDIERISEEPARKKSHVTDNSTRKTHGTYLMGAGAILTVFGFIFRSDEFELKEGGFLTFPNTLFLAGAILGFSGLYLYSTANENKKSGQLHYQQFSYSGTKISYEW